MLGAVEVLEGAVELGFEGGVEDGFVGGAWREAAGSEMPAEDNGFGGLRLDFEFSRFATEFVGEGWRFGRARRAAHGIGSHEDCEGFDRLWSETAREAAD